MVYCQGMIGLRLRVGIPVLASGILWLLTGGAAAADELVSTGLRVQFDPKMHDLTRIVNRQTGAYVDLIPESAFHLEISRLANGAILRTLTLDQPTSLIDSRECRILGVQEAGRPGVSVRTVRYRCAEGLAEVEYTLGIADHFLRRKFRFQPGLQSHIWSTGHRFTSFVSCLEREN